MKKKYEKIKNIESILGIQQFIPKRFDYLSKENKIFFNNQILKTDYLINIIHELIIKFLFTNDIYFNLWSILLKKKYGKHYNYYIKYLEEKDFIKLHSNYYATKKSKTYKLNKDDLNDIVKCNVDDKFLLKKHSQDYLMNTFLEINSSPISLDLRKKLVNDIYSIDIDHKESLNFLNKQKDENKISREKYLHNIYSIDSIKNKHIFFKFDEYGRFHNNFTILKKEIRNKFIKIDGENVGEIDLKNSQPFFLGFLIFQEFSGLLNAECIRFLKLVKEGLIYDDFIECYPEYSRDEVKILFYKVLFGNNNYDNKENKKFREIYPTVYEYIQELKSLNKTYKELSHLLQRKESDFIFKIVEQIKNTYPYIKLFTVHDSIIFPKKYDSEIRLIFNHNLKILNDQFKI